MIELLGADVFGLGQDTFDKLFLNDALHLLYLVLLLYVHNADAGSLLSGASCTSAAVGIAFRVVGHAIVDDVGQIVHVQSACRHIGGNEQLGAVFAELLHGEVALLLAQFAMQGIGVVSVAYQIVRHLLCLHSGAAEDDGVDAGIEVHNALQCQVFVFGVNHIIDVVYAFGSFVSASHLDGVRAVQVVFGNAFDFLAHGGAEKQCAALLGNALKDSVQILLESHAEHFVRLVQDHMADVGKLCHATFHKVKQSARCGYNDVHSCLQSTNLRLNVGTAIDRQNAQRGHVLGETLKIIGNLQTKLTGRAENKRLWSAGFHRTQFFQHGKSVCCGLSSSGLCQCNQINVGGVLG